MERLSEFTMFTPPDFGGILKSMPSDSEERHETLVDIFGMYLMWTRRVTLETMIQRVESEAERARLGRLFRVPYEGASTLTPDDKAKAYSLVEASLANFAKLILTMISGEGFDDKLGLDYVFRFKLIMEVYSATSGELIHEEALNRNGKKFFPDYWGRWLNLKVNDSGPEMGKTVL